jgi:GNAT superfamily N-acetyltransferase
MAEPNPSDQPTSTAIMNNASSDPLADIPPLSIHTTTSEEDQISALHLIADSVAQQRQTASRALIFHPINLAILGGLLAVVAKVLPIWTGSAKYGLEVGDYMLIGTTWCGLVMAGLVSVRWVTAGYLVMAEERGTWAWLNRGLGEEKERDCVIVSRFGEEIIGALVLRFTNLDTDEQAVNKKKSRTRGSKREKGEIRAWTTKLRYRGKGVGTGLLEEACRICKERGVEEIGLASEHANSGRVLWVVFIGGFERRVARARAWLGRVWEEAEGVEDKGKVRR